MRNPFTSISCIIFHFKGLSSGAQSYNPPRSLPLHQKQLTLANNLQQHQHYQSHCHSYKRIPLLRPLSRTNPWLHAVVIPFLRALSSSAFSAVFEQTVEQKLSSGTNTEKQREKKIALEICGKSWLQPKRLARRQKTNNKRLKRQKKGKKIKY